MRVRYSPACSNSVIWPLRNLAAPLWLGHPITGRPVALALSKGGWPEGKGPKVVYRTWLDPLTGRSLHVETVLDEEPDAFLVLPRRWTEPAHR
jgi:hypothetical protein